MDCLVRLDELRASGRAVEVTPEELILRAHVMRTDRQTLIRALGDWPYTDDVLAPHPLEGSVPGTWSEVVHCFAAGLLSGDEFEQIRALAGR